MRSIHEIQIEQIRHVLDLEENDDTVKSVVDMKESIEIAEEKHKDEIEDLKSEHENAVSDMFTQSDVDKIRGEDKSELTEERDMLQETLEGLLALIGMAEGDFNTVTLDLRHNPIKFLVAQLRTLAPYALADDYKVKSVREVWAAPVNAPKVRRVRKAKASL